MNSVSCLMAMILISCSVLTAQSLKVFGVSDLSCVFEDGYKLPETHDTIKVFGIRGEIISEQFALQALNNLTNITVEVSALNNQATGKALPATAVSWDFVGSIPLSKNAPNQPKEA